ncbi:MAG TPA: DUF1080 domain-containing protein [Verrucomicrobiae bacterium]
MKANGLTRPFVRLAFVGTASLLLALALSSCSTSHVGRARLQLFNGKDLTGWSYVTADPQVGCEQVWSVSDGVITCQGTPVGAIYRGPAVTNFLLLVEYRWPPGSKPGNSGIFSRIQGEIKPLPPAIETQLQHGNAGDVLGLQGKRIAADQPRFFEVKKHALAGDIAGVKKLSDREKPPGEWNTVEILAQGPRYTVWLNRKLVNQVDGVETSSGLIGLQSEGGVIQFRRVILVPLD